MMAHVMLPSLWRRESIDVRFALARSMASYLDVGVQRASYLDVGVQRPRAIQASRAEKASQDKSSLFELQLASSNKTLASKRYALQNLVGTHSRVGGLQHDMPCRSPVISATMHAAKVQV